MCSMERHVHCTIACAIGCKRFHYLCNSRQRSQDARLMHCQPNLERDAHTFHTLFQMILKETQKNQTKIMF